MPIPQVVQSFESVNGLAIDTISSLGITVFLQEAGQGSNDFHAILRQEFGQLGKSRCHQYREITPIDNVTAQSARLLNQPTKLRIHFRGTTRDVQGWNLRLGQHLDDSFRNLARHAFPSTGTSIDMTMSAGLITQLADVDL
jgi:hypothetical protein